ncbi:MAG: hypothetical protein ABI183_12895 [Polyangiaceae bacterium]
MSGPGAMVQTMTESPKSGCVVCHLDDERSLSVTRLSTGETVVVCGSHELMHKRSSKTAQSVAELRAMVKNRRHAIDRRSLQIDELGAQLSEAFADEKRAVNERRR